MNYYEIVIRYDKDSVDCIVFKDAQMALSSNGIIDIAVQRGLLDLELYRKVETAQSLSGSEYKYIKQLSQRKI